MAILTISRQIGSVDKEITREMASAWGYEYIDSVHPESPDWNDSGTGLLKQIDGRGLHERGL